MTLNISYSAVGNMAFPHVFHSRLKCSYNEELNRGRWRKGIDREQHRNSRIAPAVARVVPRTGAPA
jgi:hypothetical protein